jgi:hypothetical protein
MSAQTANSSWWMALGASVALVLGNAGAGCDESEGSDIYHYSLFDCPESVEEPAEVIAYRDVNKIAQFYKDVLEIVEPWIDESCFEPCADFDGYDECTVASCVTADGATLEYEHKYKYEELGSDIWDEVTSLSLIPPEGTAWTSVEIHAVEHDSDGGGFGSNTLSFEIQWSGDMGNDWPVDLSVTGERSSSWDNAGNFTSSEWHRPGCDLVVDREFYESFWTTLITVNEIEVNVRPAPDGSSPTGLNGWVDGLCVGEVDEDGWVRIGDCI